MMRYSALLASACFHSSLQLKQSHIRLGILSPSTANVRRNIASSMPCENPWLHHELGGPKVTSRGGLARPSLALPTPLWDPSRLDMS
mmetsp:Transcript_14141/g.43246  ORF Transcript_14141/g.43246 Transcript_14141/m.43246 type:complete len:87 (-) Transcript_14141:287-547(-)